MGSVEATAHQIRRSGIHIQLPDFFGERHSLDQIVDPLLDRSISPPVQSLAAWRGGSLLRGDLIRCNYEEAEN